MDEKLAFIAEYLRGELPMTALCERYGISRDTGYRLLGRYRAEGPGGLEARSRAPHRFIGDIEPAFGQQVLDIAVAQGETKIQPNRVLDDLGREAMATVAEQSHADIRSAARSRPGFRDNAVRLPSPGCRQTIRRHNCRDRARRSGE